MKTIEIDVIDIEKAAEQGLLKEKDNKPRSWEEYDRALKHLYITSGYDKVGVGGTRYDHFATETEAKAFCALGKLIQLRDAWVGDWEPDWTNDKEYKWIIQYDYNDVHIYHSFVISRPLSFPTKDMAIEFFDAFSGLLGQAKMFL